VRDARKQREGNSQWKRKKRYESFVSADGTVGGGRQLVSFRTVPFLHPSSGISVQLSPRLRLGFLLQAADGILSCSLWVSEELCGKEMEVSWENGTGCGWHEARDKSKQKPSFVCVKMVRTVYWIYDSSQKHLPVNLETHMQGFRWRLARPLVRLSPCTNDHRYEWLVCA